jgi:hypothetical protein
MQEQMSWRWDAGWGVADASDLGEHVRDVEVSLEIQGDEGQGYCLVMSPEGRFTADDWYATREEALRAACDTWRPLPVLALFCP